MRLSSALIIAITFAAAAAVSVVAANFSVKLIEETSEIGVRDALDDAGATWAEVQADGLTVTLAGTAPTEADRFAALTTAGTVVDAARVIDGMEAEAVAAIRAPRFSAEILRNDAGISIIGLIPDSTDRDIITDRFAAMAGAETPVADLIETANYPAPEGWEDALGFALVAMEQLPRAKVSVSAGRVAITAITDSLKDKLALEKSLKSAAPPGLRLTLDISAPRPVITPFTLRFIIDEEGARFDACSADTEKARTRILTAATNAGMAPEGRCTVGMGVPTPNWAQAVEQSIAALAKIGGGSVTFSDADVTLLAQEGSDQGTFDTVVGELENALPEVFALHAKLPETQAPDQGPPEFVATLSPEGQVQLRGRLSTENLRNIADSYARSRFGSDSVYTAARVVEGLPSDWSTRVLAGLESLSYLSNGAITVTPDKLTVSGNTGNADASAEIATLLAAKLGEAEDFEISVTYREKLDPVASLPTPDECEAQIKAITDSNKINFEPGSATIDAGALGTMDDIAEVLKTCGELRLEIQGHTDSQGREEMNLSLSQARAQSVLNELRARRVRTSTFEAKGYGEERPIQDNGTEEGREANRRIEFWLIRPEPSAPTPQTTLESLAENGDNNPEDTTEDAAGSTASDSSGDATE
ncbi:MULTISPECIES: OmpA family protein [Roseobacteraceae]|jgi:OOP family OmpA-OmpF porin|uniref:Putative lipoprotein YiaD n=1 Tax=Pseudosulfitobacter pseudonitzschiae TaxID=1402135 RepID=A0A221K2R0_9RHOB|nr:MULTISPECIES: OmpA family protein [Roseobacteraceae]ASM73288.1 putative lipoprotein YiaD [Pseudosulfitobacter pseudonitzschiae]